MGLTRKKITVKSKKGKTYQRSIMARSGGALHDKNSTEAHHRIHVDTTGLSAQQRRQAMSAVKAIAKVHRFGATPGPVHITADQLRGTSNIAHAVVNQYAAHVLTANPITTARMMKTYMDAGGRTSWRGDGDRLRGMYTSWVAAGAARPEIARGVSEHHRAAAPVTRAVHNVLSSDFHTGNRDY